MAATRNQTQPEPADVGRPGSRARSRKRGGGRPTSYRPLYAEHARRYCELGAIDAQLAQFFGVSLRTIHSWKREHAEFLHSIQAGKGDRGREGRARLVRAGGRVLAPRGSHLRSRGRGHESVDAEALSARRSGSRILASEPPAPSLGQVSVRKRSHGEPRRARALSCRPAQPPSGETQDPLRLQDAADGQHLVARRSVPGRRRRARGASRRPGTGLAFGGRARLI